jgi:surfeit locus 1 family protein
MTAHDSETTRTTFRSVIPSAAATLVAFALLVGLGVWQMERLAWKEQLIAAIHEGLGQPPTALEQPPDAWRELGGKEYWPVSVTGHFRHGDERRLFASDGGEMGWHVYTPLETEGGRLLLVNRGFVPDALKEPASRAAGELEGQVTVRGLVRKAAVKGWFDPDPDQTRNIWYWRDLGGMAASLGSEQDRARVLPFFVDAFAEPANPGGWPKGGVTRLEIPNRHLEYALTWFGLAAALLAVFAVFTWTRLNATGPRAGSA